MMLDKGQIKGWDGEPEKAETPKDKPPAKPVAAAAEPEAAPRGGLAGAIFDSREAVPTGETIHITPEQEKARKRRAGWTALALFAFVILIFFITIVKLGPQIILGREL